MANPWVTHIGTVAGKDGYLAMVSVDNDLIVIDARQGAALNPTQAGVLKAFIDQARSKALANHELLDKEDRSYE